MFFWRTGSRTASDVHPPYHDIDLRGIFHPRVTYPKAHTPGHAMNGIQFRKVPLGR